MDWKRLVQFALLGNSDLEQCAILLVRVSIGLFFAISGANKLFVAGGTKPVYDTLVKAKVPFPRQTAYFVSGVEFVCGSLVLRHPRRPGLSLASCQLIRTAITAGTSRVAYSPLCLHAVANTPAGRMELVRSNDSIRFGLPTKPGRVCSCITIFGACSAFT